VCELAGTYRLRSIGGASAGAIGAAVAAAAEFNRAGGGFAKLDAVPAELNGPSPAGGSVLFRLFQPAKATRGLYQVFVSALGKPGLSRILSVALAVVTGIRLVTGFPSHHPAHRALPTNSSRRPPSSEATDSTRCARSSTRARPAPANH
jgi:hypothetical protein